MEVARINARLPPEMLERVLGLLPPRDLRAAVQVCSRWRQVGEAPSLWTWVRLKVTPSNMDWIQDVLGARRLQAVRRVEARALVKVTEEMVQAVVDHPSLRTLTVSASNMSSLSPGLLATLAASMKELHLTDSRLTRPQVEAVLGAIPGKALTKLSVEGSNLYCLSPDLLATTATLLKEVSLEETFLRTKHADALFSAISAGSNLTKLNLGANNLSKVESRLLGQVVVRVVEVVLCEASLTTTQVEALLNSITSSSRLKRLNLGCNRLCEVEPDSMALLVLLEEVELCDTYLTTAQAEAILTGLTTKASRLRKLNLEYNRLSTVAPALLAQGVARVEAANLSTTKLTHPQLAAVLRAVVTKESRLKRLNLTRSSLVGVEAEVVAEGVAALVEAELCTTQLSTQQVDAVFGRITSEGSRLAKLNLVNTSLEGVKAGLLARGLAGLQVGG